ncbi:hsp90 co-chaperone Cdc37 [Saitozyma podzolica]|uniref:Hsp90 co-chaperone Cdc37 n=1 Tax=Saitozyma podzolica TaxID=1890683 RepID=A0A427YGC8_9TREE|nr:hsp90 co-chaperone Cdc37 [Saitozyma podzolica]
MPLNYSKWDMLELSDDSDIEEHPNVDKKSMIRWKQRDIHEKREARKLKITQLHSEIELNKVLRPRIQSVTKGVEENGVAHYRAVQRRLKEQPSPDKPNTGAPNQPTYDMMLGQLLGDVWKEAAYLVDGAKVQGAAVMWEGKKVDDKTPELDWASEATVPESKASRMAEELRKRLDWHIAELDRRDKEVQKEIEQEEAEQKKRITSEDIREGWSSSSVSKAKEGPLDKPKPKQKEKEETIEPAAIAPQDDADLGPLTPSARAFAQIPVGDFEKSYAFIQKDSSVLTEATHDSLLAEAFEAERKGDKALAKRAVHQALLINYCRQLGKDGVGLFFQK